MAHRSIPSPLSPPTTPGWWAALRRAELVPMPSSLRSSSIGMAHVGVTSLAPRSRRMEASQALPPCMVVQPGLFGQAELSNGAGPTVVEQWNGSQWAAVASPSPGTLSEWFERNSAISLKDIWAVGSSAGGTLAEHWDGTSWSVFPSANGNDADNVLNGVAGTSPNDIWTVGYAGGTLDKG